LNCDSHADGKNRGRRGRRKERVVRSKRKSHWRAGEESRSSGARTTDPDLAARTAAPEGH
jgi:hypothetical protein